VVEVKGLGLGVTGATSLSLAGITYAMLPIINLPVNLVPILASTGIIAIIYNFYSDYQNKLDKLFIDCGLFIKSHVSSTIMIPKKIKKILTKNGYNVILSLPPGLCLSDFKQKESAISQQLNAAVNFEYNNGNIIMEVCTTPLQDKYPFELVEYEEPLKIAFAHSKDGIYAIDIEEAIHILIAGSTGKGKSVLLRSIICSLILGKKKENLQLHLVDFMKVELGIFKKSDMVASFTSDAAGFDNLLNDLQVESEKRISMFEKKDIVNIKTWNKRYKNKQLQYIVVVVDEFAAIAGDKEIMAKFAMRMAQDRKCGIHYIVCTQRPSVKVISGEVKTNIPTRISLKVITDTDSQVILDCNGAEKLKTVGRALVKQSDIEEVQVMFISETEALQMVKHTFINKEPKKEPIKKGYIDL
jgi:S-DNA-T family DNA segregation ATPase FtsK/SpoIIIE